MKSCKPRSKTDQHYYTHNETAIKVVEEPTTYDALEASEPQQQTDDFYEPIEEGSPVTSDRRSSAINDASKYTSVIADQAVYENIGNVAPEAVVSNRKVKPKPNPKPNPNPNPNPRPSPKPRLLNQQVSTDYSEVYSDQTNTATADRRGATHSLALDDTVSPPTGDHSACDALYYNQEAILENESGAPHGSVSEQIYCNQ